jgi:hypothetical protein
MEPSAPWLAPPGPDDPGGAWDQFWGNFTDAARQQAGSVPPSSSATAPAANGSTPAGAGGSAGSSTSGWRPTAINTTGPNHSDWMWGGGSAPWAGIVIAVLAAAGERCMQPHLKLQPRTSLFPPPSPTHKDARVKGNFKRSPSSVPPRVRSPPAAACFAAAVMLALMRAVYARRHRRRLAAARLGDGFAAVGAVPEGASGGECISCHYHNLLPWRGE